MPFMLRKVRKAKWYRNRDVPWLGEGELQADALSDLGTKGNSLSVWWVEDDKSNLERVVAAVAASADRPSNVDFALFDVGILSDLEIRIEQTLGGSPDQVSNDAWHRDLVELSSSKLANLAEEIRGRAEITRILETDVVILLVSAASSGQIDQSLLKESMAEKIDKLL